MGGLVLRPARAINVRSSLMKVRFTRRRMLGCCAIGAAGIALDAFIVEPRWLDVARYDVHVRDLAHANEGFRVAHLSDLHLGSVGGIHHRIASELRTFAPQLTFLTGDTIESVAALPALDELTALIAQATKTAVVAIAGNWEHWGHVPRESLTTSYKRAGARFLSNESRLVDGMQVIAIDDFCSGNADAMRAVGGRAEGTSPRLVVTHAPGLFDALPPEFPDYALALAGHTHGGQVCAAGVPVWTPPGSGSFVDGRYEPARGPLIVSRGIGMSVFGARLTCRPEMSLITLYRE